ncbi:craniofacial development protein 2-like protein [Plakobranchus ocellatus]|uniref:Craniofacial development protein 2-like protein n=1 Tax=Plakobranchus ocellatus TaxID=259542 RepID=A0AAV4D499_9GAST|nr:craniofacial development protein 2-like protein [Plakobranchus ocellatus]
MSISDRVAVAKLVAKPLNLRIIQVYAPTSDSEDVGVEKFYEEIEKAKGYLKSQDITIVMGDFNAKVGDERVEDVVGPSGIGTVNERGSRLIDGAKSMILPSQILCFKTTRGLIRALVIEVETKCIIFSFRNDSKTPSKHRNHCRESTVIQDIFVVMYKFQIKLKKLRKAKANPKFQMDLLKIDEKLRDKIAIAVHNKYETLKNT